MLVLLPSGVAAVVEVWKVTKAFKVSMSWTFKISFGSTSETEKNTEVFDGESLRYLSYILYPLCIGGAIYSLVYTPHKSW